MKNRKFKNEINVSFYCKDEISGQKVLEIIENALLKEVKFKIESVKGSLKTTKNKNYNED